MTASPYLLPEGNVQIAFSGGRTSAYMLHQIAEAKALLQTSVDEILRKRISKDTDLRDMFAMFAMNSRCLDRPYHEAAAVAYQMADAMMEARKK